MVIGCWTSGARPSSPRRRQPLLRRRPRRLPGDYAASLDRIFSGQVAEMLYLDLSVGVVWTATVDHRTVPLVNGGFELRDDLPVELGVAEAHLDQLNSLAARARSAISSNRLEIRAKQGRVGGALGYSWRKQSRALATVTACRLDRRSIAGSCLRRQHCRSASGGAEVRCGAIRRRDSVRIVSSAH